jgi:hypothetical protein
VCTDDMAADALSACLQALSSDDKLPGCTFLNCYEGPTDMCVRVSVDPECIVNDVLLALYGEASDIMMPSGKHLALHWKKANIVCVADSSDELELRVPKVERLFSPSRVFVYTTLLVAVVGAMQAGVYFLVNGANSW